MQTFEKELNPIFRRVDEIRNFSNVVPKDKNEKEEYPHMEKVTNINAETAKKIIKRLKDLEIELEDQVKLIERESDLDARKEAVGEYNKILRSIEECIERINRELIKLDTPYFGKIIFETKIKGASKELPIYIGKFALMDKDTYQPLISDWRAPIANIYYENSGPTSTLQYESPAGIREGNLIQKRQFNISNARFKSIYDAKSGNAAADEFLLSQLNERLGQKLKDIVATIQSQQNNIIREEINKPVIIQGVAGSGKTTILLHRLAYLFYTYKESIKSERSLIIAPNKMFLDYISDVLPSLGIEHVESNTYMFWAKNILGWDNRYVLHHSEENLDIKEYKGSIEYLGILDTYFEDFESELLNNIPYSRKDIVRRRYYELKETYPYITMDERLELSLGYAFAQKQFRESKTGFITDTHDLDLEKKREISKYFNKGTNSIDIYRDMFKKGYLKKEISKYTLEGVKRAGRQNTYRMEDLAPIVYLHLKIHGHKEHQKDYVMVDEAQDLSLIQIATLLQIAKNQNITIAGDLAQSIIAPFYIKDWKQVTTLFNKWNIRKYSYHQLNRCYRTTLEIIEYSTRIFRDRFPKSYTLPEAVLRHGEEIKTITHKKEIDKLEEKDLKNLVELIKKEFEKGSVTCALVCRDRDHATKTYERIKSYEKFLDRDIVDYTLNDYKTGLLILPIEDAKGLEFDTVIILDINDNTYPDTELSTKLLYVAITRALHRLVIIENENKSSILIV
jgi:DNA helicase II / ATP-dependent DNA helicase PcrA